MCTHMYAHTHISLIVSVLGRRQIFTKVDKEGKTGRNHRLSADTPGQDRANTGEIASERRI